MKLPKRIESVLNKKQAFIDAQRDKMGNTVIRQQSQLLSDLITELIPELDVKDGMIVDNAKNYRLISLLDKTYKNFNLMASQVMLNQIVPATIKIAELSNKTFEIASPELPKLFDNIITKSKKLIDLKIGLEGDKVFKGGWLDAYFNSGNLGAELKQITSQAVTSQMNMKDYVKILKEKIVGTTDKTGALERQFNMYAYDLYQQYDAAYNLTVGNKLGFNYFIYQGGLIADSRDFCAAHDGKVWSREEAQTWKDWTPAQGEYPAGYEVKAKDLYSVPSYFQPGYDPLINRGGYHCRHSLGWIPDEIAVQMRPDLKE